MSAIRSIPPYYSPRFYHEQRVRAEQQRLFDQAYDPTRCVLEASLQGLLALGWVALGRASIENGWPLWFAISYASLPEALKKHTAAISRLLAIRKRQQLDKNSI